MGYKACATYTVHTKVKWVQCVPCTNVGETTTRQVIDVEVREVNRLNVSVRTDQDERMEDALDYGGSKSEYIRQALDLRHELENAEELIAEIESERED